MEKIIIALLAALGFGGCERMGKEMYGVPGTVEYGSPHADYHISGHVTDPAGEPVEGIQVVVGNGYNAAGILTDEAGAYTIETLNYFGSQLEVTATDIDGETNGSFATETVAVKITPDDYTGGKGWYRGSVTKEVDFELDETTTDEGN